MKKFIIIAIVMLIIIGAVALSCLYTVAENQYACLVRFSKIIDVQDTAGLHFKLPFVDTVRYFPKTIMIYDIAPSEVLTKDKKSMTVDSYVLWKISDPLTFYKTLGTTNEAENRLDVTTYTAFKITLGAIDQQEIINQEEGAKRNQIYNDITNQVTQSINSYGIEVVDVKLKRLDLPADNEQAVYTRMISERNQMAASFTAEGNEEATKIRNEVDRTVNIMISDAQLEAERIIAEGEAEYMRILAQTYSSPEKQEFYNFIRALDALKISLSGGDKTVILGADSPLAKVINNK
ncbi:MAG: protease modulator HflC [Ruminococcaceae bacterium]|nr:protease modulator HflC [Oscillospiraceae bacterium]